MRQTRRLQPMQAERGECERQGRPDGIAHVAAASIRRADPVPYRGGLGDAAPDVADAEATQQRGVRVAEDEEGKALVVPQLALILPQPPSERRACQLVARPLRLSHGQVLPAHGSELGPGRIVAHRRMAQENLLAVDLGLSIYAR